MTYAALVESLAAFILGYVTGRWIHLEAYERVMHMFRRKRKDAPVRPMGEAVYDPSAPIPTIIPAVTFDPTSGEPLIAREEVHRPSPIPRNVTVIIIVMMMLSFAYIVVSKSNEARDAHRANGRLAVQVANNRALVLQIRHQQSIVNGNEKRLENLILAVSAAKTPGEVRAAIHHFLVSSAKARAREHRYQQSHGGSAQASSSSYGDTGGSQSPAPASSRTSSPYPQPSASNSPRPSHSPHPSGSPSPTSPLPVHVCVTTPQGTICEPPQTIVFVGAFYFVR